MVYNGENPINNGWFGGGKPTIFGNTHDISKVSKYHMWNLPKVWRRIAQRPWLYVGTVWTLLDGWLVHCGVSWVPKSLSPVSSNLGRHHFWMWGWKFYRHIHHVRNLSTRRLLISMMRFGFHSPWRQATWVARKGDVSWGPLCVVSMIAQVPCLNNA